MLYLLAKAVGFASDIFSLFVAKCTIFRQLCHIHNRTDKSKAPWPHQLSSEILQPGPNEIIVRDPTYFERCARLPKVYVSPSIAQILVGTGIAEKFARGLDMNNILKYERLIEDCNMQLLMTLTEAATVSTDVNLSDTIASYAYDVLFATTVGKPAGFLKRPIDVSELQIAMHEWKSSTVSSGSYFRFHPLINRVASYSRRKRDVVDHLLDHLPANISKATGGLARHIVRKGQHVDVVRDATRKPKFFAAIIALFVAGSDPLILHILASLFHIYNNPELIERIRDEMHNACVGSPSSLRYLLRHQWEMPVLHAALNESLRLYQDHSTSTKYVSPKGGVTIGDTHVPEGCTICLEPSAAHVNPDIFGADADTWRPDRWLQDPATSETRRVHITTVSLPYSPILLSTIAFCTAIVTVVSCHAYK
ncbi:hypothetical protein BAUCODRAFT_532612 [Baudoinia panamericana UAMH 10762]|uniref:Cytochrome P450 n=1 Tax=Baudoinia panamericana (strain UAMH 10762) TaxID=717646 RepID=M2LLR2_BAUPA|nr:uncharacterized protein BAUCODRAFT_532612 [Baudoinia panamericana UAMH 10762]EMC95242.1 hypothetical protein BAUCODRAFT_532612 [Baudoinia panamericana UAMH 10762]